jgi:hypothetical protein
MPTEGPFDWVDAGPPYERSTVECVAGRSEPERPPAIPDRYAALHLEEDAVIVYDRQETNAWIQSTDTVDLEPADSATPSSEGAQWHRHASDQ